MNVVTVVRMKFWPNPATTTETCCLRALTGALTRSITAPA